MFSKTKAKKVLRKYEDKGLVVHVGGLSKSDRKIVYQLSFEKGEFPVCRQDIAEMSAYFERENKQLLAEIEGKKASKTRKLDEEYSAVIDRFEEEASSRLKALEVKLVAQYEKVPDKKDREAMFGTLEQQREAVNKELEEDRERQLAELYGKSRKILELTDKDQGELMHFIAEPRRRYEDSYGSFAKYTTLFFMQGPKLCRMTAFADGNSLADKLTREQMVQKLVDGDPDYPDSLLDDEQFAMSLAKPFCRMPAETTPEDLANQLVSSIEYAGDISGPELQRKDGMIDHRMMEKALNDINFSTKLGKFYAPEDPSDFLVDDLTQLIKDAPKEIDLYLSCIRDVYIERDLPVAYKWIKVLDEFPGSKFLKKPIEDRPKDFREVEVVELLFNNFTFDYNKFGALRKDERLGRKGIDLNTQPKKTVGVDLLAAPDGNRLGSRTAVSGLYEGDWFFTTSLDQNIYTSGDKGKDTHVVRAVVNKKYFPVFMQMIDTYTNFDYHGEPNGGDSQALAA